MIYRSNNPNPNSWQEGNKKEEDTSIQIKLLGLTRETQALQVFFLRNKIKRPINYLMSCYRFELLFKLIPKQYNIYVMWFSIVFRVENIIKICLLLLL